MEGEEKMVAEECERDCRERVEGVESVAWLLGRESERCAFVRLVFSISLLSSSFSLSLPSRMVT
jgi:hypothetical protein